MQGFILETLLAKGWRKGGEVYWTQEDATEAGCSLIKRKLARRIRILPAEVALQPVAELPKATAAESERAGA
jgi:hypothetical protein